MGERLKGSERRLIAIESSVHERYPYLAVVPSSDRCIEVAGILPVIVNRFQVDHYSIRLLVPSAFPKVPPELFETGGRIPHTRDRHINRESGRACIFVEDEWGWLALEFPTIGEFLGGPVNDFLYWQTCYEHHGKNVLPEWPHGGLGRLEFYKEKLRTSDTNVVIKCLRLLADKNYVADKICYCGSGQQVHKCHKTLLISLRSKIPPRTAIGAIEQIQSDLRNQSK